MLPGALAVTAGAGAVMAAWTGALYFAAALLLACLGALLLRRGWAESEKAYRRAFAADHEPELPARPRIRPPERRELWVGETAAQVRQALGDPEGVDVKPLKTRKREVWKYGRTGLNRYATRITLDNDTVVRWQKRDRPARTRSRTPDETHT